MIKVEMDGYDTKKVVDMITKKTMDKMFENQEYFGNIPEEGVYTSFDKFKNQIANLIADKVFKEIVESKEIEKGIEIAIQKAEKVVNDRINKKINL